MRTSARELGGAQEPPLPRANCRILINEMVRALMSGMPERVTLQAR
jgi:hypothetical protein